MSSGLPAHVEEADLISYGLIGLISAIERFEPEREIKFETYAVPRIRGAIIDELRSLDWVPRSVRARAREIEKVNVKLEHKFRRAPTDEEMAAELGIDVEEFQESLIQISNSTIAALDELWTVSDSSGDSVSLLDTIHDPSAPDPARVVDATDLKDRVADAIARLPEREKLVIALYYYENLTLREIGEVLSVTESRISQLHTKAVLRLRSHLQEEDLERELRED
jgi:RNA polymerase sigma factor for flagellar operon FliA